MGRLVEFVRTGSIGPVMLGMSPFDVGEHLGEPSRESRKKNPLTLEFGSLRVVFWKHPGPGKSQLREIAITFAPEFAPLPAAVALDDFQPTGPTTEKYFREFMHKNRCIPVHMDGVASGRQMIFLSGVVVRFSDGLLESIYISQKETKENSPAPLSDLREPSRTQILEMISEAERVLNAGAPRAALMIAWAGLEATLRRVALEAGMHGQIGVQPSILIRELLSANVLSANEARILEDLRQLRTASVHGLAPVEFDLDFIPKLNDISRRMLTKTAPNLRKQKEVADIVAVDEIDTYSVIVQDQFYNSIFAFFRSRGLYGRIEMNAISGSEVLHQIQIEKSVGFTEFSRLLNEWKESYVHG